MKAFILVLALFFSRAGYTQQPPLSAEAFINAVYAAVLDSNLSSYYLAADEAPCSFVKFDYDEWYKYGLDEDVPVYILQELAKKCFEDNAPRKWVADQLLNAVCIEEKEAGELLSAATKGPFRNTNKKSGEKNVVFSFSRPAFTDDGQYAVIDMSFRCDNRQCGMGATFLFRQVNGKWKLAGKKLAWSS